ncbi:DUF5682 family protein [Hymenobacter ginsengisoli]|uniref:DUF5682 family protein n=1 Tax=Hymenobacter ginsengisoli TaxID=1051626 RepID=A0ABP8QM95_9BACT|nr:MULTISPECIES: DUF5682 family protein [unclassified Hymenobacter]MBO2033123.1 hypothetical protein [Hymenobacter sp. BT559]
MPTDFRLFGIRHHGPGSAASLVAALDAYRPDIVLLECPADGEAALATLADPELLPPVALLLYNPKQQGQASFLPFAEFSPEWQAVRWCQRTGAHVRCFDLPLGLRQPKEALSVPLEEQAKTEPTDSSPDNATASEAFDSEAEATANTGAGLLIPDSPLATDPVAYLAGLAGYTDPEQWWETYLEHAPGNADTFALVLELMTALREESQRPETAETLLREAYMRETLRATLAQGYARVAVVCGAWHAPVLTNPDFQKKEDKALLKGLKKTPIAATWIPWTYERLSVSSGYGAGVLSPAWYELLFTEPRATVVTQWMVRAARLLRGQDLDASSAHAIEAVRLADTLATVRGLALPGIAELQEAAVALLGGGYAEGLAVVQKELVIGEKLGAVPAGQPATPLQQDLAQQQKTLRLKSEPDRKPLALDLRQETHLLRSHLLHRLRLLDIRWGKPQTVAGGKAGTFHEEWELAWPPEMTLAVLDAGRWGNTVLAAAAARATARAAEAPTLDAVSSLLEEALRADLGPAIGALVARLETLAADTRDVTHLLTALPPLAQVLRYGNVRRTDTAQVAQVVQQLVPRLAIGLPAACTGLDLDAARPLLEKIEASHEAIRLLQDAGHEADWYAALAAVQHSAASQGLLAGAAARLLFNARRADAEATATTLGLALASAQPTAYATAWIEGFLRGSGLVLIHHRALFDLLDTWLGSLTEDTFRETVPLLRRAFAEFSPPERRQIMDLAAAGPTAPLAAAEALDFDWERGARVLPVLRMLLGAPAG